MLQDPKCCIQGTSKSPKKGTYCFRMLSYSFSYGCTTDFRFVENLLKLCRHIDEERGDIYI